MAIMRLTCMVVAASSVAILPYSGTAFHRDEDAFMTAWAEGRALTPDEAVEEAPAESG
jgi:hypothetical protein